MVPARSGWHREAKWTGGKNSEEVVLVRGMVALLLALVLVVVACGKSLPRRRSLGAPRPLRPQQGNPLR